MNLSSCGLALSAWMLTGNDKFRTWMIDYTSAWIERADSNGGLVPDNVGPDGVVGQLHGGQWFGGLYGWAWPHGAFSVLQAVAVASLSCHTATGDDRFLDFIRGQLDRLMELGQVDRLASASGALREEHLSRFRPEELDAHALLIPHRHNEDGWHDFLPMELAIPTAVWLASGKSADWSRIEHLRSVSTYDWTAMRPTRQKEDSGHEEPWLAFLSGTNPQFPEKSISMADEILAHRLDVMSKDATPSDYPDIHHWQNLNPVSAEVLLQNRVGGCSPLYYGGLLSNAVRFRVIAGSAAQLASSVSSIGHDQVELTLECLEGAQGISVHLEAGAFGQHRVDAVAVGGNPLSPHELQSLTVAPGTTRMIVLSLTRNAIAPTFPTIATELSGPPR